jgi:hypothetical protein
MKSKKLWIGIMVMILLFGIMFAGCEMEPDDPTYTVWTDSAPASEFPGLNDGYYIRYEFTTSEWNSIKSSLTNEGKYNWTESEIKKWFIGRGFGNSEANQETSWLITINHGMIVSRSGAIAYILVK